MKINNHYYPSNFLVDFNDLFNEVAWQTLNRLAELSFIPGTQSFLLRLLIQDSLIKRMDHHPKLQMTLYTPVLLDQCHLLRLYRPLPS